MTSENQQGQFVPDTEDRTDGSTWRLRHGGRRNDEFKISMSSFEVKQTFAGLMEGTLERASQAILEKLEKRLSKKLPWNSSLVILPCDQFPLPRYQFLMQLHSGKGTKTPDAEYASSMTVCFFADTIDVTIEHLVAWVVDQVNWREQAKEYSVMDAW